MISIEEYIANRKKEDKLNEFDFNLKQENLRTCVNYVFEYYNNVLNITEAEERTILKDEKLDKLRKQLEGFSPNVIEWIVNINNDCNKRLDISIGKMLDNYDLFYIYDTDSEFREISYEIYTPIIKKIPMLKGQSEMIFTFIKDYHRVKSENFNFEVFSFSEKIQHWLTSTYSKHNVNIAIFAYEWVNNFWNNEDIWPVTHRRKSTESWRKYDYDIKQKSNLFNLDSLYRKIPKKSFIKGRKQELEIIMMYYWFKDLEGDNEYWQQYLEKVLPLL